jgi:hypothetical protein
MYTALKWCASEKALDEATTATDRRLHKDLAVFKVDVSCHDSVEVLIVKHQCVYHMMCLRGSPSACILSAVAALVSGVARIAVVLVSAAVAVSVSVAGVAPSAVLGDAAVAAVALAVAAVVFFFCGAVLRFLGTATSGVCSTRSTSSLMLSSLPCQCTTSTPSSRQYNKHKQLINVSLCQLAHARSTQLFKH